jgi:hypothetical protein
MPSRHWYGNETQSHQHYQEANPVEKEVPGIAEFRYSQAREGRSYGRSAVEEHRLQADGIGQILLGHDLRYERPARGLIETQQRSVQE